MQHSTSCHHISVLWLHHTFAKAMNKIISTGPHCFMMVVWPSGSGKTHLVSQLLKQHREIFRPNFEQFLYFYIHFQPVYQDLQIALGAEAFQLCQGVDWLMLDKVTATIKQFLLVFDDVFQDICGSKEFLNIAISGRHQKLHMLVLKHNLYQQSPNSKTIDLNLSQMLLLLNPTDTN